MNSRTVVTDPLHHHCQALVIGCFQDGNDDVQLRRFDQELGGLIDTLIRQQEFTGKAATTKIIHTFGKLVPERILLVGLGKKEELDVNKLRDGAGAAAQALKKAGVKSVASLLHLSKSGDLDGLVATAEGFHLGGYAFDEYRSDRDDGGKITDLTFIFEDDRPDSDYERALQRADIISEAVYAVRNMVAQPGNVATPAYLAEKAAELARQAGMSCQVLEREDMEREGMGGILAVAQGSRQAPKFIVVTHSGAGKKKAPVVLVGKGVTFDSGGISLKPREGMERMKDDMAGAAAVLGTVAAAARLELPVNLVGIVPAAENLPDGNAYRPGDVVRTMGGKTIEIVNTDAEGRLLLCDALHYARRLNPSCIIDIATLTGACVVALGSFASGILGNDQKLIRSLQEAGAATGERLWELPLWEEYGELMKSDIADLKNAGGPTAGTITAGWFLKQFVGDTRWAHLDIAGTAWEEKGRPCIPKGATGVGVRLLVEYLSRQAQF